MLLFLVTFFVLHLEFVILSSERSWQFVVERRTEESSDLARRLTVMTAGESTERFVVTLVNQTNCGVTSCETKGMLCYFVWVMNFKFVWKNHIKTQLNQSGVWSEQLIWSLFLKLLAHFHVTSIIHIHAQSILVITSFPNAVRSHLHFVWSSFHLSSRIFFTYVLFHYVATYCDYFPCIHFTVCFLACTIPLCRSARDYCLLFLILNLLKGIVFFHTHFYLRTHIVSFNTQATPSPALTHTISFILCFSHSHYKLGFRCFRLTWFNLAPHVSLRTWKFENKTWNLLLMSSVVHT